MARTGKHRPHKPAQLGPRLYKRGRYWWADLRPWQGPRTPLRDPKHPDWPSAGARTEDETVARDWAAAYVRRYHEQGRRAAYGQAPPGRRLDRAVKAYLEHRATLWAPNTVASDRSALNHIIDWCGPELLTDRLVVRHNKTRVPGYAYLQDLIDQRIREEYEPSTMLTWVTCWAPFFQWLESSLNVWEIKLPAKPERDVRPWSDDELVEIRKAADWVQKNRSEADWPAARRVVEFFLASGCREQEGYVARIEAIRKPDATIRLVGQLNRDHRAIVPLKGKRNRTALLLPFWWKHHKPGRGYVLARTDGECMGYRSQVNLLNRILDAAQVNEPGVGHHRFRHTYSRLFIEGGGRLEELQHSLGHSSIVTTEREYGHLKEDVAAKLAKIRIYGA